MMLNGNVLDKLSGVKTFAAARIIVADHKLSDGAD